MRTSVLLLSALAALAAAIPAPNLAARQADARRPTPARAGRPTRQVLSASSAAASSTGAAAAGPNCLAATSLPADAAALPAPDTANTLVLIAQGVGTQNYTCANDTATPSSIGAVATLSDISCSSAGPVVGRHFFADLTTPEFDVARLGNTQLSKTAAIAAPANTDGDVPWLLLTAKAGAGTTSNVKQIYRLLTEGGSAPASCAGQPSVVTVDYKAQYWFYASA